MVPGLEIDIRLLVDRGVDEGRDARADGRAISVAGGRHAMGGQQFGEGTTLIDMGGLARAMRDWARSSPHEFQLIYGTPITGYVAPPETIPAAARVADPYLRCAAVQPLEPFGDRALRAQMSELADLGLDPSGAAATLAELAALVGFVNLELAGHFVGTADPADRLFDALVRRQCASLRLGDSVRP